MSALSLPPLFDQAELRRVERVARAIDPVAWEFIDGKEKLARENPEEPAHPALELTRRHRLEQAPRAIAATLAWEPIDTAPPDCPVALLYVVHPADEYAAAVGEPGGWANIDMGRCDGGEWDHKWAGESTHWMLPPDPPLVTVVDDSDVEP